MSAVDEMDCGQDASFAQRARDTNGILDSRASVDVAEELLRDCLGRSRSSRATLARIPTMTREELETLRDRYPSAHARLREMEADDKRRAEDSRERRPEFAIPALSAKLCRYAQWREAVIEDVRREQRYSAETGVANLAWREQAKAMLRDIDDASARWGRAFVNGPKPLPCSDEMVSRLTPCVYSDAGGGVATLWVRYPESRPECASAEFKPYLLVLGQ
jgi:hypothetical protein